jgi:Beta-lactamase
MVDLANRGGLTGAVLVARDDAPGGCDLPADVGYGYGWFVAREPSGTLAHHEGRIDGYLSFDAIDLGRGVDVVVLSNSEATDAAGVGQALLSLVT